MKKRGIVFILFVAGMFLLPGCGDPSAQIKAMTDHYHDELDRKEEELTRLRESEKMQQSELAALKAEVATIKAEAEKTRGSQLIDPKEISKLLVAELEPKLEPIISKSVEKTMKNAQLAPVQPATPSVSSTGKPVPPTKYNNQQPKADIPTSPGRSAGAVELPSNDPNVQRFEFRFD